MRRSAKAMAALALVLAGSPPIGPSRAAGQPQSWPEVKCARYRKAWSEAVARVGTKGLGPEFLAQHEAFLASGCTARGSVCPRSEKELALADVMVLASMNFGTASTFPPFACHR